MSFALNLYHRLPAPSRSIVASLRGYYLDRWRYDKNTEKLVEEALERETWSKDRWEAWRSEQLTELLERAATRVPFYREQWEERRRLGDRASWSYLENWPVLEKHELRQNNHAFLADDRKKAKMFRDNTSGTTGTSLDIWSSRETVKHWYALSEARWRRWYGVSKGDRWAILGGQLVTPVRQTRPPFWVWNAGLNQLYMSSYHMSPQFLPAYLDALSKKRVRYIVGYTSSLYSLARAAVEASRTDVKFDVVITNAEPLYDHQRELISQAFGCPVKETYGMAEMVAAASECSHNSLHLWPEAGVIETDGGGGNDPEEFICTGLINPDMPLIRYRIGDSGKLSDGECGCGRTLPKIDRIEGRNDDLLYTTDGRRIGRLDPVFKDAGAIAEAQIIQRSLRSVVVKYVATGACVDGLEKTIAERVRDRLGDVAVEFEVVPEIPRTSRGKFRAVICELREDEGSELLQERAPEPKWPK